MSQKPKNGGGDANKSANSGEEMVDAEVVSWMNESVNLETSGWTRQVPTAQQLREQNKRLRPIFAESGQEYGENAKTAEAVLHRRRQAIKIRNEQLFKAMQKIASARHVDLCFVVDATSSMERYIKGVKDAIRAIADNLIAKKTGEQGGSKGTVSSLRLGLVAYRDHGDHPQYGVLPFTESVKKFHGFCSKIDAVVSTGRRDRPENVLGGLNKALEMDWSDADSTKVIFHTCDHPARGRYFHNSNYNYRDDYGSGDPNGLTAFGIFAEFEDRGIDYYFGKITEHTDTMIARFADALGDRIDQFDIKNVQEICGSVIAAVSTSVCHATRKTGPSARPKRSFRIDTTIPDTWDAHVIQNGKFLTYQLPESVDDVLRDVPLERRPTNARIRVAAHPFAKGGERIAYYGRDLRTREDVEVEEDIVLKEYIRVYPKDGASRPHEFANQLQTIATYFAALFMADCEEKIPEKIPASLDFLKVKTLALGTTAELRYMSCEPRLDPSASYIRFTNNWDFVMLETGARVRGVSVELLRFVLAFSHYTYHMTDGKLMIVDLQGTIKPNTDSDGRPTVLLTDPAIHCEDRLRFGSMNHSKLGMKLFFESHTCNEFCEALNLPKVDASKVLST